MKKVYQIALTMIPGIGDIKAKRLMEVFPDIEDLFNEKKDGLKHIFRNNIAAIELINNKELIRKAEEERNYAEKNRITILFYTDDAFPSRLRRTDCPDSPVIIYYKGNTDLNHAKVLSIVGTRKCTEYGKKLTSELIQSFSSEKIIIVSGLAYGIDIEAHKAALNNGLNTIGVLAHGLDRIYPGQHTTIARQMIENGGLLSDYRSGTNPDAGNFPARNRIIAALSDATIVVEAGRKGGALITAEIANSYNRDVFTFPGDVGRPSSEGCNYLIKTNKAVLIQSAEDVNYHMGWINKGKKEVQQNLFPVLSENETRIYNMILEKKECNIDEISTNTELTLPKIAAALLNMELQNVITCLPGKKYKIR